MASKPMWMVRAGEGAQFIGDFTEKSMVAIGWGATGPFAKGVTREEVSRRVGQVWPEYNRYKLANAAGQIYRFVCEISEGDGVISYDPSRRVYLVGKVSGDSRYDQKGNPELQHFRNVVWEKEVSRDSLSVTTKNTLGAIQTLFLLSESAREEILKLAKGTVPEAKSVPEVVKDEEDELLARVRRESIEFIKDRLNRLDWDQMQHLVAGLLRGMGYKTRVSPQGPDRGKDIVASPDGFGFELPRIIVEVKHRKEAMGSQDIRSFIGGRHKDDKGLFVSTGGFTKDAFYEAERSQIPLTLMDLDELAKALTDHYETMDHEARALIPLTRIYWPA